MLAALPISLGVYAVSRTGADGKMTGLSKVIDSYSYYKQKWASRNTLHTAMIEQAAFDRHLFQSTKGSAHIDLKFPEYVVPTTGLLFSNKWQDLQYWFAVQCGGWSGSKEHGSIGRTL